MTIRMVNGIFTVGFSAFGSVTVAVLMLLVGAAVKRRSTFLRRYCIPAAVIGGVIFAFVNLALHLTGLMAIKLDTTYQNDMQFMFFTIVGFGASYTLMKKGGVKLVTYFILTGALICIQGIVGVFATRLVGIHDIYGIVCGPASLAGGHGSVAAYGLMLEDMGHQGALVAGMASATFGLITGSLFGGPLCDRLIRKHRLTYPGTEGAETIEEASKATAEAIASASSGIVTTIKKVTPLDAFVHIGLIGVFMTLGNWVGVAAGNLFSISLPGFTGPLVVACVVRNLNEKFHWFKVNEDILNFMSEVSLGIFLSMAMISLNLWQLFDLAIPMLIILMLLLVITLAFVYYIVFRVLGGDFHAAVMCAGLTGHGLGATPNGIANMDSVSETYGVSRLAFLIVPIVGGFLQDMFLVPINVFMINLLG